METAPAMDQDISNVGPRRSLIDICHSLFGKHPKIPYIACNLCKSGIKIVPDGQQSLSIDPIISHACIHAGLKIFECRCSEYSSPTRSDVQAHIEGFHRMKPRDGDLEDQSEKFHDEISNSIKRCFTECNNEAPTIDEASSNDEAPKKDEASKKDEAPAKDERHGHGSNEEVRDKTRDADADSHYKTKELAYQRHSFFNRIIKESVHSDGKVKCRVCSKKITVTRGGNLKYASAIQHAESHLRKPLYRCGVCKERLNTYPATIGHLRVKHALGMAKNFECIADEFHSDILEIFAQCYKKA